MALDQAIGENEGVIREMKKWGSVDVSSRMEVIIERAKLFQRTPNKVHGDEATRQIAGIDYSTVPHDEPYIDLHLIEEKLPDLKRAMRGFFDRGSLELYGRLVGVAADIGGAYARYKERLEGYDGKLADLRKIQHDDSRQK